MPVQTQETRTKNSAHDGRQIRANRNSGTVSSNDSVPFPPLIHFSNNSANIAWFIFTLVNVEQGTDITAAHMELSSNNAWTNTGRTYIAVENNLDPLGEGAIVPGIRGSAPFPRLERQADAITLLGARCGPTHSGNLSTTGVPVRDPSAYIYRAFGDSRGIPAQTDDNPTDDFASALQALVNDPGWNSESQDVLIWMFSDENTGSGPIGNLSGYEWSDGSGQTGSNDTFVNGTGQLKTYDNNPDLAPKLVVSYVGDPPPPPPYPVDPEDPWVFSEIEYHDGIGSSSRRDSHLYVPNALGDPPPNGWPVVVYIAGGSFNTNSVVVPSAILNNLIGRGYAVMSMRYKVTTFDIFLNTNTGFNRPSMTQDALCFLKWVKDNSNTHGLNPDKVILAGESAGAHLAMEAALASKDPGRDTYEMAYSGTSHGGAGNSQRRNAYNNSPILDQSGGRSGFANVCGVWAWGGPFKLSAIMSVPLFEVGVRTYYGEQPANYIYRSTVAAEGDLEAYILGEEGSVYETKSATKPDFLIGICHDTEDIVVKIPDAVQPFINALDEVGYDISTSNDVLNPDGLTMNVMTTDAQNGHERILSNTNWELFRDWVDAARGPIEEEPSEGIGILWWENDGPETISNFGWWDGAQLQPVGLEWIEGSDEHPSIEISVADEGSNNGLTGDSGVVQSQFIEYEEGDIFVVSHAWARSDSTSLAIGVSGLGLTWDILNVWLGPVYGFRRSTRMFIGTGSGVSGIIEMGASGNNIQDMVYKIFRVRNSSGLIDSDEIRPQATQEVLSTTLSSTIEEGEAILSVLYMESADGAATIPSGLNRLGTPQTSDNIRVVDAAFGVNESNSLSKTTTWSWSPRCYCAISTLRFSPLEEE